MKAKKIKVKCSRCKCFIVRENINRGLDGLIYCKACYKRTKKGAM